jgi:NAD(P)-dependent dehydrogenase (short-subunit alcohol dehydrogenase family)
MAVHGFETTTDDVIEGVDLQGRVALVTGASGGLGKETARALAAAGARVIIAARDKEKSATAASEISESTGNPQVETVSLELTDLDSVRDCAGELAQRCEKLDILVNNAGVMACPLERTADGYEMQIATCHLGHFLLTVLLLPLLEKSGAARVVNLSSGGHKYCGVDLDDLNWETREYNKWLAYGQAKTANILFTFELDQRFKDRNIRSFAVHPGVIHTDLGRHLTDKDIEDLMSGIRSEAAMKMKSVPQGAATSVWAACASELEGKGGLYLEDCVIAAETPPETASHGYSAYAMDAETARGLWELSEKLTGINHRG